jgi:hypothetical protein
MPVIAPTFTPNFDTNFGAHAAAAKACWIAAAQVFVSHFADNIHINITVDAVGERMFSVKAMRLSYRFHMLNW